MLIKICGVKDPETARFAAEKGADFIGVILSPGFKRSINLEMAHEIVLAARQGGAEPVAVFVASQHVRQEMEQIVADLGIQYVQAYGLKEPLLEHLHFP